MAVPKRKMGRSRTRARKSDWMKLAAPGICKCPQCSEAMRPHRVCPHCGHYKGREIIKESA